MKKPLALLLCSAMVVGALVGCGSKKEETKAAETTAETTGSDKEWIIATDTVFKPFEYTDESGNFVGIDVDILAAIAEDQGFKYELQSLGFDAAAMAVQAGQADAIIAGATINVAVKQGTAGADFANSLKDEYGFTVTIFEDSPSMYQDVVLGNSAACVEDTPIMASNIKEGGLELKIPEGMESEGAPYGFAIMDEKNQELLDMFNAGLANIKENGTYDEIIAKYLGE